jgi:hypothetical protein
MMPFFFLKKKKELVDSAAQLYKLMLVCTFFSGIVHDAK